MIQDVGIEHKILRTMPAFQSITFCTENDRSSLLTYILVLQSTGQFVTQRTQADRFKPIHVVDTYGPHPSPIRILQATVIQIRPAPPASGSALYTATYYCLQIAVLAADLCTNVARHINHQWSASPHFTPCRCLVLRGSCPCCLKCRPSEKSIQYIWAGLPVKCGQVVLSMHVRFSLGYWGYHKGCQCPCCSTLVLKHILSVI